MKLGIREILIWQTIVISLLITISTEVLSFFNLINSISIKIFWLYYHIYIFLIFLSEKKFYIQGKISI